MRVMYPSKKGGKPLNIGMNRAKRLARLADRRDQLAVIRELGPGLPRQHTNHQALIKRRHEYYGDIYEEAERARPATSESAAHPESGDAVGEVPAAPPGTDPQ